MRVEGVEIWRNFVRNIAVKAQQTGGFGTLVVRIQFHRGLPQQHEVVECIERVRNDNDLPPVSLTKGDLRSIIPDDN